MDISASQRLATVRALEANTQQADGARAAGPDKAEPIPIEEQISTSMTQTLKALNVRPDEDVEEEKPKKGFFSRFRRS